MVSVSPLARDNEGISSGVVAASSFCKAHPTERMKNKGDSGDVAELWPFCNPRPTKSQCTVPDRPGN